MNKHQAKELLSASNDLLNYINELTKQIEVTEEKITAYSRLIYLVGAITGMANYLYLEVSQKDAKD